MTRIALVTGAGGFVGRNLVAALRARGEHVRALDLAFKPPLPADECIVGSVTDRAAMAAACAGADSVFHCAAIPQLWHRDPDTFRVVNVEGTRTVVEAATAAGVRRLVHVSSYVTLIARAVAGTVVDESAKFEPADMLGSYPRSKLLSERVALETARGGLECVVVMPSAPVGPLDYHRTPPTRLIRDLVNGRVPAVVDCLMNLVDVRSLAEATIAARDRGRAGERYLLTGEDHPMMEFLSVLQEVSGIRMPTVRVPYAIAFAAALIEEKIVAPLRGRPPGAPLTGLRLAGARVRFDNAKAKAELGFASPPIRDGLRDALLWMRSEGLLRRELPGLPPAR